MNQNILYLLVAATPNFILVAEPCEDLEQKSCWQVINQASVSVALSCNTDEHAGIIAIKSLKDHSNFSHNYFHDADFHLGFLRPNVKIVCIFKIRNKKINFDFTTIDSGDRVKFLIDDHQISVEVHQFWAFRKIKHEIIVYRGP